ncbi:MAG TPA: RNA 2',3'-cyclic phosphodiesterase [Gaiellaceae bacterium]|nr:RNA 2',3'-cyclic phosphodiesterase [Gaiellaceae bacterium]
MSSSGTVGADEGFRLFLGFRLPDPAAQAIVAWERDQLSADRVRTVPAENLHVTIAFLGSRPAGEVGAIAEALRAAVDGVAKPVLTPVWYRETRSVGMLVFGDAEGRAARIAEDAHRRLERLGVYEPESRKWLPHVTVVRFRERPRFQPSIPDLGPVTMSDAAVYMSRLRPDGAQYEVLESVPLGGG